MGKKILILIILILLPFIVLAYPQGDVNGDNKVNSTDYIAVRKHILKQATLTGDKFTRADLTGDNKISSVDYIAIRKIILKENTSDAISTSTPVINPNTDYIEAYFLNTYNHSSFNGQKYGGNDSFIFKTNNGKYVLLDTGINSKLIKNVIYNSLKDLQKNNKVTIDYLVLSHMHADHIGNAVDILGDSKILVKNLIIKKESLVLDKYNEITNAAKSNGKTKIIETDSMLKEGDYYTLSNNVKMYLFNVSDIYIGKKCNKYDYIMGFTAGKSGLNFAKSPDDKYIYFKGQDLLANDNKLKLYTTSKLDANINKENMINSRFNGFLVEGKNNNCSANANSIAVLFQIKTTNGNKYIYLPSDLENNGYDPFGEYDNNYKTTIHGYMRTYFYEYELINGEPRFIVKNNKLVKSTKISTIKIAAAYETAKKMKDKFKDLAGNITIYQQAHHGLNNYAEVVNLLKLNNKSVYTVAPLAADPRTGERVEHALSEYNLRNTIIMFGGGKNKNGVNCIIKGNGTTRCVDY